MSSPLRVRAARLKLAFLQILLAVYQLCQEYRLIQINACLHLLVFRSSPAPLCPTLNLFRSDCDSLLELAICAPLTMLPVAACSITFHLLLVRIHAFYVFIVR